MEKLLQKLNLNFDSKGLKRGRMLYSSSNSLLVLEILGGCFKIDEAKKFVDVASVKYLETFPNIKYFSLKLDDNSSLSMNYRKELFEHIFLLNYKRKNYEIKLGEKIFINFKEGVHKKEDKLCIALIASNLGIKMDMIQDISPASDITFPFKEKKPRLSDVAFCENAVPYELEELPINSEDVEKFFDDVKVIGKVFKIETKNIRQKVLHSIYITNYKESVQVRYFDVKEIELNKDDVIEAYGRMKFDTYANTVVLQAVSVVKNDTIIKSPEINALPVEEERCELHVHSNFDTIDAIPDATEYYKNAKKLGISSLAICDKENVLSFFKTEEANKEMGIKGLYGTELKIINENEFKIFYNNSPYPVNSFVGIDIETTGLSPLFDEIIEISAYKKVDGKIVDYSVLVNRENGDNSLSTKTTELTSITKEMLDNEGIDIKLALQGLLDFIGDAVIIGHNATFDVYFIEEKMRKFLGVKKNYSFVDTMNFARVMIKNKRSYQLQDVASYLKVNLTQHHRAIYDAICCYEIFFKLMGLVSRTELINNEPNETVYAEVKTNTTKALEKLNSLNYEILSQEKIEGLKNSYISVIKFDGNRVEETFHLPDNISSLKVNTVYKENKHFYQDLSLLNNMITEEDILKHQRPFTITALVKNQEGLKDLYKLISLSHTKRITSRGVVLFLSDITKEARKNLLIGSSSRSGIFEKVYFKGAMNLPMKFSFYDYIEFNPKEAYYSIDSNIDDERIKSIIKFLGLKASKLNLPFCMASDAHYIYKEDSEIYKILNKTDFVGGKAHPYKNATYLSEFPIYSTSNMIKKCKEYGYDDLTARKYVIDNPFIVSNLCADSLRITPDKLYVPTETFLKDKNLDVLEGRNITNIKEEFLRLINLSLEKYKYEGKLPEYVEARVKREVDSITQNGYHIIYYISYLLVKKSLMDGYSVGSRGSVGSSFVANLMGITEVNALKPHYRCPKCNYQIYKDVPSFIKIDDKKEAILRKNLNDVSSGFDLKPETCPCCGENLVRDGHDIPFETFLGFNGDKVPDIDLNFASVYQSTAHLFTKELFGENNVVRAGTISKFADKTAFNIVKDYYNGTLSDCEVLRKSESIVDIKRTTGQHASGIVVIPEGMCYEDFMPVQYPANDNSKWLTTHFDYKAIHDNLLKLDILGHIDPTVLKALMDEVRKNPSEYPFKTIQEIPFCDQKIYDLLRKDSQDIVNALGISEFGTNFVMGMLKKIHVESFADLIKVSGLSHGTDVWQNNGEDLVSGNTRFGTIPFKDTIGCRDDIMVELMHYGLKSKSAFDIMEFVRKGKLHKGETEKWEKYKKEMIESNVPEWYIWSLSKIKYMFPKAHAIAYVMSALRIAWFKVYKPLVFYKVYLSIRDKKFDTKTICTNDVDKIEARIDQIKNDKYASAVEKDKIDMLEFSREMINKGFRILLPNINKSSATEFLIVDDKTLLCPFNMIDGVGDEIAKTIERNRTEPYKSLDDLKQRGKANKKFIDGCLELNIMNFD